MKAKRDEVASQPQDISQQEDAVLEVEMNPLRQALVNIQNKFGNRTLLSVPANRSPDDFKTHCSEEIQAIYQNVLAGQSFNRNLLTEEQWIELAKKWITNIPLPKNQFGVGVIEEKVEGTEQWNAQFGSLQAPNLLFILNDGKWFEVIKRENYLYVSDLSSPVMESTDDEEVVADIQMAVQTWRSIFRFTSRIVKTFYKALTIKFYFNIFVLIAHRRAKCIRK